MDETLLLRFFCENYRKGSTPLLISRYDIPPDGWGEGANRMTARAASAGRTKQKHQKDPSNYNPIIYHGFYVS